MELKEEKIMNWGGAREVDRWSEGGWIYVSVAWDGWKEIEGGRMDGLTDKERDGERGWMDKGGKGWGQKEARDRMEKKEVSWEAMDISCWLW
jgi:hypothetical protein